MGQEPQGREPEGQAHHLLDRHPGDLRRNQRRRISEESVSRYRTHHEGRGREQTHPAFPARQNQSQPCKEYRDRGVEDDAAHDRLVCGVFDLFRQEVGLTVRPGGRHFIMVAHEHQGDHDLQQREYDQQDLDPAERLRNCVCHLPV